MNSNQLFKLLIDISFYLLFPVIFLFPGAILYFLIFPDQEIVSGLPYAAQGAGWKTILLLCCVYVEYVLFFIGFYNLRKFAALLLKNRIFTRASVKRTRKIGWFFSVCGASGLLLSLLYTLIFSAEIRVEFGISDTQLFLFLTIIGVFFLILSSAFERALKLEKENKLTV